MTVAIRTPKQVCPKCDSSKDVVFVEKCFFVCTACHTAWEEHDRNKLGWVCPKHNVSLEAHVSKDSPRKVDLWCFKCNDWYTIPTRLADKLKRAFVVEEEI